MLYTMNDSIFRIQSIDRNLIHWEDHLLDLSPCEKIGGMWFKREDFFAPLGFGGINGSKLRVCIWLINEALKQGAKGVSHGAVIGSPQHPMVACIAAHYNVPVIDCIGTKKPLEHETLATAAWMGAEFRSFNPGFAATLNSKAEQIAKELRYFHLETNITVDQEKNPAARVEAFHKVGSVQVQNIPDHIENIIVPAGSCNSVTSVLYGIAQYRPKNLQNVILMGIGSCGSSDPTYIHRRLQIIEGVSGVNSQDMFGWFLNYKHNNPSQSAATWPRKFSPIYTLTHYDVNGGCGQCKKCEGGYCTYNDLMPYRFNDLDFHPRYEGKMMCFMGDHLSEFQQYLNDKTLFWIVGSKPSAAAMAPVLKEKFGDFYE
jgi:1-aminocyclopropane-1-carboxylate deaminase/D-cysteine desulfhydrase-like pyridoxal-dependent ACC family enzyme